MPDEQDTSVLDDDWGERAHLDDTGEVEGNGVEPRKRKPGKAERQLIREKAELEARLAEAERNNGEDSEGNNPVRGLRKALRSAKQAIAERDVAVVSAEERAAALERENAMLKADLPDTEGAAFFDRHFDIEAARDPETGAIDPERIRQAFARLDYRVPMDPQIVVELAAHDRVAQAAAGAEPAPNGQKVEIGSDEYKAEIAKCQSTEELLAVMQKYGSPIAEG